MSDYDNPYLRDISEAVENHKLGSDPGRLAHYQIKAALAIATEMHSLRLELQELIHHLKEVQE
jgi:hypothetical protein